MKKKLITIILTILIIALVLAIMPGSATYTLPKVYILLVGSGILLVLMFFNYKNFTLDVKDYLLIIFAVLTFISTILSSNVKTSILGTKGRWEGMLAIYAYIIIYFCAKKFLEYKNSKTILNILYGIYIPVCILGIAQHYINFPTNALYPIFNKQVCGTFGNSNFMGSFLSIGIPIFIITYIIKGNKLSFITSLLTFFVLVACRARSGWIAFAAFGIILIIYLIKQKDKKYIKRTIILFICFALLFTMLYIPKKSIVRNKVSQVKSDIQTVKTSGIDNQLGSSRIEIWKISLELILKYPLFGVGTDNLKDGITNNLTQTSREFIRRTESLIDKAHNEYLQIAVTIGIPALFIYLAFLATITLPKLKDIFKREKTFLILSIIISYLVQAFFNISVIGVAPLFWIVLGIADNEKIVITKK